MKTLVMTVVSAFVGIALAADITINEATNFNETVTFDNVYANANVQVGDTASSTFKINSGKYVYLPGAEGKSAIFRVKWGTVSPSGNSAGFKIGYYSGFGYLQVLDCASDVILGRVEVYDGASAMESGYVDLRVAHGKEDSGNWRRVFVTKILNYRTASKPSFRILVDGPGGVFTPSSSSDENYFYVNNAGTKTILEGSGKDIVFLNGVWFNSGNHKSMRILQPQSQGILRTQGNCDLVFHNHNAGGDANTCPVYVYELGFSTNRFEWAHTGETVISNACMLKATADYALPNGPQTGSLRFAGANSLGNPWLDLCGTRQIVNGVRNGLGSRYWDVTGVTDIRSVITNSSATAASLTIRNGEQDDFCVGYVKSNISLAKEGAGTLLVSRARFSRNDFAVRSGTVVLTNAFEGVAYELGAVTVADGARLVVDGCTLDCTSLAVSGSGCVEFRNGGAIKGVDVSDVKFAIDSSANDQGAFLFSGLSGTVGAISVEKTGDKVLTVPCDGQTYGDVCVRSGTLRPAGQAVDKQYWRYTFTETTENESTMVHLKGHGTVDDKGYDTELTAIWPRLALNRIHQFNALGAFRGTGLSWAGMNAATLAAGSCTANMTPVESSGFYSSGGYLMTPGTLFAGTNTWYYGVAFLNGDAVSPSNPLVFTFRYRNAGQPSVGYLMMPCVNYNGSKPRSWTIEASDDGESWTTVDVRSNFDPFVGGSVVKYPNGGVPYLFESGKSGWTFVPAGTVSVDAGATLDTSDLLDENVSIRSLTVDMARGAGRITKFVPAAGGELRIVNMTGDMNQGVTLFELGSVVNESNLKSWSVYVDGVREPLGNVKVRDGRLYARSQQGAILIYR